MTRQVVLDTETTGLNAKLGDRIIELGCVEILSRRLSERQFHTYLNPQRDVDLGATRVHGLTLEDLRAKPKFADVAREFLDFIAGAELIIHNAEFDVGFLNMELARAGRSERVEQLCTVTDTLTLARRLHPGQKNGLDALCKRFGVDNSHRDLHGALLDARLLVDVYLAMTGGQAALTLERAEAAAPAAVAAEALPEVDAPLVVIVADTIELDAHRARLKAIAAKAGRVLWAEDLAAA